MNVVGYARLSKAGNGHSIEAQSQAIRDYCERQDWTLLGIEVDEAASGKSTRKRPGLRRALESCSSGAAGGIVAAKLDRLSRSLLDFAKIVEDARKHGYTVVAVDQSFDLNTPNGRAMAGMLAVFAEWERETISERTKAGLEVARRKGRAGGNPNLVRVSEDVRARIRELRALGLSLSAIARQLEAEKIPTVGGGAWRVDVLSRLLSRERAD